MLPDPPGKVLSDEDVGASQEFGFPQYSFLVLEKYF